MAKKTNRIIAALLLSLGIVCTAHADSIPMTNAEIAQNYRNSIGNDSGEAKKNLDTLLNRNTDLVADAKFSDFLVTYANQGPVAGVEKASHFIDTYPNRAEGYFWRGYFYKQSDNKEMAIENLEIAREINKSDISTLTELTDVYFKSSLYDSCYNSAFYAVEEYEKGNKNISNNVLMDTILMGGESAINERNYPAADVMLQKAFDLGLNDDKNISDAKKAKTFYLLARSSRGQNKMNEAYTAAHYAVTYEPTNIVYVNFRDVFVHHRCQRLPFFAIINIGHRHKKFVPPPPPMHRHRHIWDRGYRPVPHRDDRFRPNHGPKPVPHRDDKFRPDHGPKPVPHRDDKFRKAHDSKPGPIHRPAPNPGPRPTPGPIHRPAPGPRPTPGPIHRPAPAPGPRPTPGPIHRPAPNPRPRPTPGPIHRPAPGPRPTPGPIHRPAPTPRPAPSYRPATNPRPTPSYRPAPNPGSRPAPSYRPAPNPGPRPAYRPAPNQGPRPAYRPAPNQGPRPAYRPAPSQAPSQAPNPNYRPIPSQGQRPTYRPAPSAKRPPNPNMRPNRR